MLHRHPTSQGEPTAEPATKSPEDVRKKTVRERVDVDDEVRRADGFDALAEGENQGCEGWGPAARLCPVVLQVGEEEKLQFDDDSDGAVSDAGGALLLLLPFPLDFRGMG